MLMTLGIGLAALAVADATLDRRALASLSRPILTFGRVPMFYYVAHLYLIHLLALAVAVATGDSSDWLGWRGAPSAPEGYGHGLPFVYLMWALAVLLLYLPCVRIDAMKRQRRSAWLRSV
jgi:predicted acyltransferase